MFLPPTAKECLIETQETGAGGAVSASPLPVGPSPTGAILPSIQCHGRDPLSAVNVNTLTEILFLLPMHGHRANRHTLARPAFRALAVGGCFT